MLDAEFRKLGARQQRPEWVLPIIRAAHEANLAAVCVGQLSDRLHIRVGQLGTIREILRQAMSEEDGFSSNHWTSWIQYRLGNCKYNDKREHRHKRQRLEHL